MTAHWMLYCAAVALLLGLGALATERALAAFGRPTRWAWAAALLLSLAVPAAARFLPRPAPPAPAAPARVASVEPAADAGGKAIPLALPARLDLAALDRPLLVGWGAASALALLALAGMAAVLERRRRSWRPARVSGEPVLVSPDTGPAVVGLFKSRIVFPEWAYAAGEEVRALMLEHEREHVRARDPLLLAGALAVVALLPWSPAAWWQLRRLRLAVEVDCDARVLRRRSDLRAYGALLLEVGRRAGRSRLALAAFSEPTSFLERRIRTMTAPRVRQPWLRAAGFGAAAAALLAAACEAPGPLQPAPAEAERVYSAPGAAAGVQPSALTPREAIARFYPDVLTKGAGGRARLLFVLSPAGEVVGHELQAGAVELREDPDGSRTRLRTRRHSGELEAVPGLRRERVADGSPPRVRMLPMKTQVDPDRVESVELFRFRAGQMGPDPVEVVWVREGEPGAARAATRARLPGGSGLRSLQVSGPRSPALFSAEEFAALVEKHRPALPEGVSGRVMIRVTVGPDRRAADVALEGSPHPLVAEAARRLAADLVFPPEAKVGEPISIGVDFAMRPRTRVSAETSAERAGTRIPAASRELIAGTLKAHYPEVLEGRGEGEYWFVIDGRGRIADTGGGSRAEALAAISPDDIAGVQVENVEAGGHTARVLWIRLKG